MPKLTIQRDTGYADRMRAYKVILDGRVVAKIKNGQRVTLEIDTGEHELFLKVDWCRSNKLNFSTQTGEDVAFSCGSSLRGMKVFLVFFYATILRHKYLWLGPAPDDLPAFDAPAPASGLDKDIEFNWQIVVVAFLFLATFAVVGARSYAYYQLESIKTVDHLAFDGQQLCVHHNLNLYLLTPGGWLRDTVPLSDLGINSAPADLEFAGDGRLLIGDGDGKAIYSCDLAARQCEQVQFSEWVVIRDNYKFTYDRTNGNLYVADTNHHSLVIREQGRHGSLSMPGVKLSYPNDMLLTRSGDLLIADTKNSRISALELDGSTRGFARQYDMVDMSNLPEPTSIFAGMEGLTEKFAVGAISRFPAPLALAESAEGNLWAVVADAYINYGEVWEFDRSGELQNQISLSERSIPIDIVQVGNRLLVSDMADNKIYAIEASSGRINIFGDEQFQNILSVTREERLMYQEIKANSFRLIAVLLMGLVLMLMVHRKSQEKKQK